VTRIVDRWRRPRLESATLIAIVILGAYFLLLSASFVLPESAALGISSDILTAPSSAHPMGTDQLGRDLLARVVMGARTSISVVLPGAVAAMVIGSTIGLIAGYVGGTTDGVAMRGVDVLFAFPPVLLALAIVAGAGPGPIQLSVAIAIVYAPMFVRVVRGPILQLREREFVAASRLAGGSASWVMTRHLLPNVMPYVIVQFTLTLAWGLLTVASLSFLGLGIQPPTPDWGALLNEGRQYLTLAPWISLFPGVAIALLVISLNLLGDALRSGLDPRFVNRGGALPATSSAAIEGEA
jgi:peptide/nickel transport system permease protein